MENLKLFRLGTISTNFLLLAAILTPIATVAIDFSRSANGLQYLEYVCVWCQYGSTDNNPDGTAVILNFTSIDFFYMWIPLLVLFGLSFLPILKSFPQSKLGNKISDAFAINSLWIIAVLSIVIRFILGQLVKVREAEFKRMFPDNMVIGELGWGAASLIIATIFAAATAMIGFIEFQYDLEDTIDTTTTIS